MELPNLLSKVIQEYGTNPGKVQRRTSQFQMRQQSDIILRELAASINDKAILAYLWLAIEYGCSILVLSESDTAADRLIDALGAFVPAYKVTLDLPRQGQGLDRRLNFVSMADPSLNKAELEKLIGKLMPDMVLLKGAELPLSRIFSLSKQGISFMAHAKGNFRNRQTARVLQSRRFGIGAKNISALDVSILLQNIDGAYKISAITEYRWIEKAEIRPKEGTIPKRMENIRIIENGHLNAGEIGSSKLIERYARSNLISKDEALADLKDRADFLERMCASDSGSNRPDSIPMYYEIR